MSHFLAISDLTPTNIEYLIDRALVLKSSKHYPTYPAHAQVNLFYENSTRTRVSFELAATRLAIPVINLDLNTSSESKGEVILDTLSNLSAMGIDLFVMRHHQNGLQEQLSTQLPQSVHLINAGDGTHAHPSQALLDVMTIREQFADFSALKVAIVGNIRHSRVANSLQVAFKMLGLGQLMLVAPQIWQPEVVHFGELTDSLQQGIKEADVVIALRVQKERILAHENIDFEHYRAQYAITEKALAFAKSNVILMHPGPVNRGVEVDSVCVDAPNSSILKQVTNGVFMRMAILEALIEGRIG